MILTDKQFKERKESLMTDTLIKKQFVEDKLNFTNLYDFLTYEIYKGSADELCEKLAEYFDEDFLHYCEELSLTWFEDEDDDAN